MDTQQFIPRGAGLRTNVLEDFLDKAGISAVWIDSRGAGRKADCAKAAEARVPDISSIIENLYDAVLDFALWPKAIEDVADALSAGATALLSNSGAIGIWLRFDPGARVLFESRFVNRNPYSAFVARQRQRDGYTPAISTDHDISAQMDIKRTEYFNEYLRPFDFASSLVIDLGARGMTAALNVSHTTRQGAFTARELAVAHALHPHLMRAFRLSVKLAERQQLSGGVLELLERATFAVFLLDDNGRVAHSNAAGEEMLRTRNGLRSEDSTLATLRGDTTSALHKLVADAVFAKDGRKGGTLSVARHQRLPLTVTVTPLSAARASPFHDTCAAIVCVFDPAMPMTLPAEHLREMFGLTAAEARVAMKLLEGLDQKAIAQALGISFFTVRAHLSQIYQKTHTARQAEFVALVMRSISPFGRTQ